MAKKNNFTFIDFITDIIKDCITNNGTEASPYDVEFANHYHTLYDFSNDNKTKNKVPQITKVIQNTKRKSVTAEFDKEPTLDVDQIKDYCDTRNLDCCIQDGCLKSITINKKSKGVMEERKWKK